MINFLIVTALFIIAIFFEAFAIDPLFWKGGNDDKPVSTYIRAVFMIFISFVAWAWLSDCYMWAAFIYGLTLYFGLFNYVVNWSLGKAWFYLGDNWYDRKLKKVPIIALVFFQLWVMTCGVRFYLNMNGTIEGNIFNIPPFK